MAANDPMYQDRKLMLDPETAKSRLFVKNLPSVPRQDIEEYFQKFGKVVGVMQQRNYGFIQMETEDEAAEAIKHANGSTMFGKVLEVAPARPPMDKAQLAASRGAGRGGRGAYGAPMRDRSPVDWGDDRYEYDSRYRGRGMAYREEDYYPESVPTHVAVDPRTERTNHCEIIVHNQKQRGYAEAVEAKLKSCGLLVDLMFPNESIPVTRVLASISKRGTLYAITISPQNQERRSLTVNILQRSPEEHRNMPLDDAIALVHKHFNAYRANAGGATPSLSNVPGTAVLVATNHPDNVVVMLNLLAQNRSLTVLQYDTLLRYLMQRREQQVKLELGDTKMAPVPPLPFTTMPEPVPPVTTMKVDQPDAAQAELLKSRIMSILNQKAPIAQAAPIPTPVPAPIPEPKLMEDPKVQLALNSLFKNNDFLNFKK